MKRLLIAMVICIAWQSASASVLFPDSTELAEGLVLQEQLDQYNANVSRMFGLSAIGGTTFVIGAIKSIGSFVSSFYISDAVAYATYGGLLVCVLAGASGLIQMGYVVKATHARDQFLKRHGLTKSQWQQIVKVKQASQSP